MQNLTPRLGIGTWHMGDDPRRRASELEAIRTALDAGVRLVDTAEMYGSGASEDLVGEAIKGRRDEVYLVSKVLPSNASRRGTGEALRRSLRHLDTDYLDLYLLHWPGSYPLEDTIEAFEEAIEQGLIKAWGVSNFDPQDLREVTALSSDCVTNQVLYNLVRRGPELDLFPQMRQIGMPTMAYSPIEQSRLFTHRNGPALAELAAEVGVSPSALALAWVMRDGETFAIPQSSNPDHVRENLEAMDLQLAPEVLAKLDEIFPAPRVPVPLQML